MIRMMKVVGMLGMVGFLVVVVVDQDLYLDQLTNLSSAFCSSLNGTKRKICFGQYTCIFQLKMGAKIFQKNQTGGWGGRGGLVKDQTLSRFF